VKLKPEIVYFTPKMAITFQTTQIFLCAQNISGYTVIVLARRKKLMYRLHILGSLPKGSSSSVSIEVFSTKTQVFIGCLTGQLFFRRPSS